RRLHAESGGALIFASILDVDVDRLEDTYGVEAEVLEEALVFDRSNGVNEDFGDVLKLPHPPFFACRPGNRLDELRLELVLIAGGIVLQGNELGDLTVGEADETGFLVEVRIGLGEYLDVIRMELEVADRVTARLGITGAAQVGGDALGSVRIAHRNRFG